MDEAVAPRRRNVMSLEYILCSDAASTAAPNQATIPEEDKPSAAPPLSVECTEEVSNQDEPAHASPINQPPPANISIYLNDFDEDETRVIQLHSPTLCNLAPPVCRWAPRDGFEDVDIDQESLRYPPRVSCLGLQRARRERDDPGYLSVNRAMQSRARRTRGVLSPTQSIDMASTTHIAHSHLYRRTPKGGIPRDVIKSRTQRESIQMDSAATGGRVLWKGERVAQAISGDPGCP